MCTIDIAREVFDIEIQELEKLKLKIGKEFDDIIECILDSKGRVIITGIGKIKAAISLTSILSSFNISKSDLVINIGLCGSKNMQYKIGETFLCNKIVDNDTKMTYFADIVFKHPFNETSLQCCSRKIDNLNLSNEKIISNRELEIKNCNLISSSKFIKQYKEKNNEI